LWYYIIQIMARTYPLVSIIVHTKNSERTIKKHLESIKKQSYKNIEIIAVDNFSNDKTFEILKRYTKKVFQKGPERSVQRNFGVSKSRGRYVLIPDSDMYFTKNVVSDCVNLVTSNPELKAVIIPETSIGDGYWTQCKILERECYKGDDAIEAARFFERKVFVELGGYDENITGPEDWDLHQQVKKKYTVGRIKSDVLHDEGKISLTKLVMKKFYYAKKTPQYIAKHSKGITITQSIYLFRPAFYRNWKLLLKNLPVTIGMIIMLILEQIAFVLGFLLGKLKYS
jgi:glycosyltransferase involved in cell wall biosynthesis